MKTKYLILLLITVFLCGCAMEASGKTSDTIPYTIDYNTTEDETTRAESDSSEKTAKEETSDKETAKEEGSRKYYEITYEDWPGDTVTQPDFWMEGLINTYISSIRAADPTYTEGVTLEDTHLYSAPNEGLYDLGIIYQGRKVKILKQVEVEYSYEDPEEGRVPPLSWYLVSYTDNERTFENIGYVRCDNIGDVEKVSVEPTKPWTIKAGVSIYTSPTCQDKNPDVYQYTFGRIYDVTYNEETNITTAKNGSSLSVYLKGRPEEVLEPFSLLGEGTTKHGN